MAEVLIQNQRDPNQVITVVVTIRKMVIPEEGSGGPVWVLEALTDQTDADGDLIPPVRKYLSSMSTVTADINDLISEISALVPWNYEPDYDPPEVVSYWPLDSATGVSVETDIRVTLTEVAPSAGIDLSSIQLKVKGFDLTDQVTIEGDLRECTVSVVPGTKYKSAIESG